jgi:hypothetical protein
MRSYDARRVWGRFDKKLAQRDKEEAERQAKTKHRLPICAVKT